MSRSAEEIREAFERDGDALINLKEANELGLFFPNMKPGERYSLRTHEMLYSSAWINDEVTATVGDKVA